MQETTPHRADPSAGESAAGRRLGAYLAMSAFLFLVLAGCGFDPARSPVRTALVLTWPVALLAFVVTGRASAIATYLLGGGLALRLAGLPGGGGSDVLAATNEAIATLLAGGNPYDHFYAATRPAGSPFPYPPVQLLIHLPGHLVAGLDGVQVTELAFAAVVMILFTGLARRISWTAGLPALGIYASAADLVNLTVDGSNDTSAGAALLVAVLAFAWAWERGWADRYLVGAGAAAALALGTKQSTLLVILVLAIALWQVAGHRATLRYVGSALLVLAFVSLPFLAMGPLVYLRGLVSFAAVHEDVYGWNIWVLARSLGWPVADVGPAFVIELALTAAALIVAAIHRYRDVAAATAAGILVTLVPLLTARWTTYAYFAMVAPVALAVPLLRSRHRRFIATSSAAADRGVVPAPEEGDPRA